MPRSKTRVAKHAKTYESKIEFSTYGRLIWTPTSLSKPEGSSAAVDTLPNEVSGDAVAYDVKWSVNVNSDDKRSKSKSQLGTLEWHSISRSAFRNEYINNVLKLPDLSKVVMQYLWSYANLMLSIGDQIRELKLPFMEWSAACYLARNPPVSQSQNLQRLSAVLKRYWGDNPSIKGTIHIGDLATAITHTDTPHQYQNDAVAILCLVTGARV